MDRRLPMADCQQDNAYRRMHTGECLQVNAYRRIPTGECLQENRSRRCLQELLKENAYRRMPIGGCLQEDAYRRMPIGECLQEDPFYQRIAFKQKFIPSSDYQKCFKRVLEKTNTHREKLTIYKGNQTQLRKASQERNAQRRMPIG